MLRTKRAQAVTVSDSNGVIRTRNGLMVIADMVGSGLTAGRMLAPFGSVPPVQALDWALAGIAAAYGEPTAMFVAEQMEYPGKVAKATR